MIKKLIYTGFALLLLAVMGTLTACSGDDEEVVSIEKVWKMHSPEDGIDLYIDFSQHGKMTYFVRFTNEEEAKKEGFSTDKYYRSGYGTCKITPTSETSGTYEIFFGGDTSSYTYKYKNLTATTVELDGMKCTAAPGKYDLVTGYEGKFE